MTAPILWFDEFAFLKYNMVIYEAASPAAGQAAEEAQRNGKPYFKAISTTPGDLSTEYGRDALAFRNKCADFKEEFYDWDIKEVKKFINKNSSNGFALLSFTYQQLGRGSKYYDKCLVDLGGNFFKMRREVLLEWISINSDGPFDDEELQRLKELTYDKDKTYKRIYIDKYYLLTLYKPIPKDRPVIISCDVGSGSRRDYSTISIIDSKTKDCIGEFYNNKVDTLQFSSIIYSIGTEIAPNCLIVIERNNVGSSVISNLKRTGIKSKLYYEIKDEELKEQIRNGRIIDSATDSRFYGLWTDTEKRELMMELLVKFVRNYPERLRCPKLVEQICGLIYNKNNRIDHRPNEHDDCVMAYLIGIYTLYYGKSLAKYGIVVYPDVDPKSGLTEEEVFAKTQLEEEERKRNLSKINMQLNAEPNENIVSNNEFKTINDYYAELDKEREMIYNNDNEYTVSAESVLLGNNRIDLLNNNSDESFVDSIVNRIIGNDF